MKKHLSMKTVLLFCFFLIGFSETKADSNLYHQLSATAMLSNSPPLPSPNIKKKPQKTSKKQQRINPRILPKPSLFSQVGKINAQLQYSMVEITGTQLSVDGFSLLPIFVAGNIESQDIVRTGHRIDFSMGRTLTPDSQVILNIPYRQESEQLTNDEGQTTTQTRKKSRGLGDVSLTYLTQMFKYNPKLPSLIGLATWKPPTGEDAYENTNKLGLGTGFHSIRTGIRVMKQDDPVFLFANIGYTWNIKGKKRGIGTINSGNIYDVSFGSVYSLTDSFSMSFALEQAFAMKTTIDKVDVVNSDKHTAAISIGGSLKISPKQPINIYTKIGLNESTPGFQLQISTPLKN